MSVPLPSRGEIFQRTIDLYRKNFWPLTFFGGLFWIVLFVGPSLPSVEQAHYRVAYWIVAIITILASIVVSSMCVVWGSFEALHDRPMSIASALRQVSLRTVLRFAWAGGLSMLCAFLGVLALVIPGLIVGVRLSMVAPVVVIEGKAGWQALARSWQLVKGRGLKTFGWLLLLNLPTGVIGGANSLLNELAVALGPPAPIVIGLVVLACSVLAGTFSEVGLTVLYADLVGSGTHTPSALAHNPRLG